MITKNKEVLEELKKKQTEDYQEKNGLLKESAYQEKKKGKKL